MSADGTGVSLDIHNVMGKGGTTCRVLDREEAVVLLLQLGEALGIDTALLAPICDAVPLDVPANDEPLI